MNRGRERMDTENREKVGDRRWMREAVGRRYLTAFDIQLTPELASEAILHEWPISGLYYQFTPAIVFRVELIENYNRIFYNWAG